ncbi:DUF736 family protein [Bradyrhizobium diazoefficiens]|nr:DUF736 family protein [Bradyrhizobium diazoefficiens]
MPSRSFVRSDSCFHQREGARAAHVRLWCRDGAARRRISKDDHTYHSVKLDDPPVTVPIYANVFEDDDGELH